MALSARSTRVTVQPSDCSRGTSDSATSSLSSTTSRRMPRGLNVVSAAGSSPGALGAVLGRYRLTVVPLPSSLAICA